MAARRRAEEDRMMTTWSLVLTAVNLAALGWVGAYAWRVARRWEQGRLRHEFRSGPYGA
jgi:hypothetical protein